MQQRRIVARRERESVMDHHRLNGRVQNDGHRGIFEIPDLDDMIDEGILAAAKTLHLAAMFAPLSGVAWGHDKNVEARLIEAVAVDVRRQRMAGLQLQFLQRVPGGRVVTIGVRKQRAPNLLRQAREPAYILSVECILQGVHQVRAGIRPVILDGGELAEKPENLPLKVSAVVLCRFSPCDRSGIQLAPTVAARFGGGEKRVDRLHLGFCCNGCYDRHRRPPQARSGIGRELPSD